MSLLGHLNDGVLGAIDSQCLPVETRSVEVANGQVRLCRLSHLNEGSVLLVEENLYPYDITIDACVQGERAISESEWCKVDEAAAVSKSEIMQNTTKIREKLPKRVNKASGVVC